MRSHFCGVLRRYAHEELNFTSLLVPDAHDPARSVPPQYEELDIGEDEPVRCLKNGLWFLRDGETRRVPVAAAAHEALEGLDAGGGLFRRIAPDLARRVLHDDLPHRRRRFVVRGYHEAGSETDSCESEGQRDGERELHGAEDTRAGRDARARSYLRR